MCRVARTTIKSYCCAGLAPKCRVNLYHVDPTPRKNMPARIHIRPPAGHTNLDQIVGGALVTDAATKDQNDTCEKQRAAGLTEMINATMESYSGWSTT